MTTTRCRLAVLAAALSLAGTPSLFAQFSPLDSTNYRVMHNQFQTPSRVIAPGAINGNSVPIGYENKLGTPKQEWMALQASDGTYRVINRSLGRGWALEANALFESATMKPNTGTPGQRWHFIITNEPCYELWNDAQGSNVELDSSPTGIHLAPKALVSGQCWTAEKIEAIPQPAITSTFVRLKGGNGQYMHMQANDGSANGTLQMGAIQTSWQSAMWALEKVPNIGETAYQIKNRLTGKYLTGTNNGATGSVTAGTLPASGSGGQWAFLSPSGATPFRLENRGTNMVLTGSLSMNPGTADQDFLWTIEAVPSPPALTSVTTSPTPAPELQNVTVTVDGTSFDPATVTVTVFSVQNTADCFIGCNFSNNALTTKTSTQLKFTVNQRAGDYVVVVANGDGQTSPRAGLPYTIVASTPVVSSFTTSPNPVVAGQSFTMTVTGSNFITPTLTVGPNVLSPADLASSTATSITTRAITVPAAGSWGVSVRNVSGANSNSLSLTAVAAPVITSIVSSTPPAYREQPFTMVITGTGFDPATVQLLQGSTVYTNNQLSTKTATSITAFFLLPAGSIPFRVRNGANGPESNVANMVVLDAPVIDTIVTNPAQPIAGQSFTVTLTGRGFEPATAQILFGGTEIINSFLTTKTTTQLSATITMNAGTYQVKVRNGPIGATSLAKPVTVNSGVSNVSQGSYFVPIEPCRAVDTRSTSIMAANTTRDFTFGACNIPSNATAVALNVTLVPTASFGFISIWPAGQAQPVVSTMNSLDGRIKANAAIVGVGGTNKAVSVYVTDSAHVLLDVNGYFVPAGTTGALAFYPVTPCRVLDTRAAGGGGVIASKSTRRVSGGCLPTQAQAYSLNVTVVPKGPLGFLTLWPEGSTQPTASTLNDLTGTVVANAAILRAGTNGAFNAYVTDDTDMVVDLNGYFAPAGQPGALALYPLQPCRIFDTRAANGAFGGPAMAADSTRNFIVPSSACGVPTTAQAYVTNATMVPSGVFGFLTLFPGGQARPTVSTLNAIDGALTSNAAILPAGPNGVIQVYTSDSSHMLLDISGYFAP